MDDQTHNHLAIMTAINHLAQQVATLATPKPIEADAVYSARQASKVARIASGKVLAAIKQERLKAERRGKSFIVRASALNDWIANGCQCQIDQDR